MKMLGDELGTASNIKSRVNRLSVLAAITSAQQRLKLYNKVRGASRSPVSNIWCVLSCSRAATADQQLLVISLKGERRSVALA